MIKGIFLDLADFEMIAFRSHTAAVSMNY